MEDEKVVKIDTSLALTNVDKLNKSLDGVDTKLNNISNNVKQAGTNISTGFNTAGKALETFKASSGAVGQATSALLASLTGVNGTLKGLTSALPFLNQGLTGAASGFAGMTAQAIAFIATPVGAVIAAIAVALKLLADAFKRNEDAMASLKKLMAPFQALWQMLQRIFDEVVISLTNVIDKFNGTDGSSKALTITTKALGVVLGVLSGALKLVERNVSAVFNVIGKLTSAAKNFIDKTPLKGFLEDLGVAFEKVRGAVVKFVNTVANSGLGKLLGWDIITDEIKNAVKETDELTKSNLKIVDLQTKINKLEEENVKKLAENESKISELREQAADKEKYSAAQRKKFLEDANKIDEDNLKRETELAQAKLDLIKEQNSLTASNAEDRKKEANAEAELDNIKKKYADKQKERNRQIIAINQEIANAAKAKAKAELDAAKAEADAAAAKVVQDKKNTEESLNIELEKNKRIEQSDEERLKKEIEIENKRLALYDENTLEHEKQQTKIADLNKQLITILSESAEKSKELANSFAQDIISNTTNWWDSLDSILENNSNLELQAQRLADEQAQLDAAHEQGLISEQDYADAKKRIQEESAKTQADIAKASANAQIASSVQMVQGLLDVGKNISSLFADESEEAFEAQKAFEISSAVISTLMGAIGAYTGAASNPGLNAIPIVGPALAQAMGITNAAVVAAGGAALIAEISKRKFGDKSTNINSKLNSGTSSNVSTSAASAAVIQPAQYEQAVDNAQLETKIGDTRVYVTEEDITNTQKRVSVQEQENTY